MDGSRSDDCWLNCMIAELSVEVLQVIVSSRSPSGVVGATSMDSRDGGFDLRIGECPAGGASYGKDARTMVIDVILVERSLHSQSNDSSPRTTLEENRGDRSNGKVIERWVLHYDTGKGGDSLTYKNQSLSDIALTVRKRLLLLVRSLYVTVRLLPTYKTTRAIASSNHSCSYSLAYRVSSFAEPFNDKEDEDFQQFRFSPVDVVNGRLCLSVLYYLSTLDVKSYPSVPLTPRIIPNYIGSAFADPLKRLPLLTVAHLHKPTLTRTGRAPVTAITPLDSSRQGSKQTKRRAHVIRNGPAIQEIVSERRNGSIVKHEDMIPSSSFTQLSFIKCYRQPSWKEFEYDEITCPFDMDDDYSLSHFSHRRGREHQHNKQGSVSQYAFVGALVDMLKRAPPLREEYQDFVNLPQPSPNTTVLSKTTADAMEELKSYRKMKCLLMGP